MEAQERGKGTVGQIKGGGGECVKEELKRRGKEKLLVGKHPLPPPWRQKVKKRPLIIFSLAPSFASLANMCRKKIRASAGQKFGSMRAGQPHTHSLSRPLNKYRVFPLLLCESKVRRGGAKAKKRIAPELAL